MKQLLSVLLSEIDSQGLFDLLVFRSLSNLETEYRLFPPVTIKPNLFPRAGYFFNAFD